MLRFLFYTHLGGLLDFTVGCSFVLSRKIRLLPATVPLTPYACRSSADLSWSRTIALKRCNPAKIMVSKGVTFGASFFMWLGVLLAARVIPLFFFRS